MKRFLKLSSSIIIVSLIIIAGIFCYKGVQTENSHCAGGSTSSWCIDLMDHGTIISGAILNTVFLTLIILSSLIVSKKFSILFFSVRRFISYSHISFRNKIPILSPVQIAISNGIIHSRIP